MPDTDYAAQALTRRLMTAPIIQPPVIQPSVGGVIQSAIGVLANSAGLSNVASVLGMGLTFGGSGSGVGPTVINDGAVAFSLSRQQNIFIVGMINLETSNAADAVSATVYVDGVGLNSSTIAETSSTTFAPLTFFGFVPSTPQTIASFLINPLSVGAHVAQIAIGAVAGVNYSWDGSFGRGGLIVLGLGG